MNVVILPAGAGKTHMMMRWLALNSHRVLVVSDEEEALRLKHLYRRTQGAYADDRIFAFSTDLWKTLTHRLNVTIGIDNLEMLLVKILRQPVEIVTMRP